MLSVWLSGVERIKFQKKEMSSMVDRNLILVVAR